jgi:hypothetical protein
MVVGLKSPLALVEYGYARASSVIHYIKYPILDICGLFDNWGGEGSEATTIGF